MNRTQDRRLFLKAGASILAASSVGNRVCFAQSDDVASAVSVSPSEKVSVGIMGVNNRGKAIAKGMLGTSQATIAYICDVDRRAAETARDAVAKLQAAPPKIVTDFRRMLDDDSLDAVVIATPNHWHAPATILACDAGKHVYVEKPCSHTAAEGEWAISAARRNNRVVQTGTQRRSWPAIIEAIGKVHAGEIGEVLYSRTWYNNRRESIGVGKPVDVPEWLQWDLWQGPAPRREYKDNLVHYNWHWHWHWGNGELGNNGVHGIDLARWGLDETFPTRVTAGGGKYRHDDDQDTPDTMMVSFDFDSGKTITWEGLSWSPTGPNDTGFGISFHGTDGTIVLRTSGYTHFDLKGKEVTSMDGPHDDRMHSKDFFDCIRTGTRPRADIEEGHRSALLCHLGNIAYRTSSALRTDSTNGHIIDNHAAESLWSREYQDGWMPKT